MSDRLSCPHACGYVLKDLWDYSWESEVVLAECPGCNEPVDIHRHQSVSYEIRKGDDALPSSPKGSEVDRG